jgi:hypothetical protein
MQAAPVGTKMRVHGRRAVGGATGISEGKSSMEQAWRYDRMAFIGGKSHSRKRDFDHFDAASKQASKQALRLRKWIR